MKINNLIKNINQNILSYGCQLNSPASEQIELLGMAGFDFNLITCFRVFNIFIHYVFHNGLSD